MRKFILLVLVCLLATYNITAQNFSYTCPRTVTVSCGPPCITLNAKFPDLRALATDYKVSNVISTSGCYPLVAPGTPGSPTSITSDDTYSSAIPITFTFPFYGSNNTSLLVSTNGYLCFDLTRAGLFSHYGILNSGGSLSALSGTPQDVPSSLYDKSLIMGPYHDLDPSQNTSPTRQIKYDVIGTAPNRKFIVSFYKEPLFLTACNGLYQNTQQIILHESSGVIEVYVQDKQICNGWNMGLAMIGLQDDTWAKGIVAPGRAASSGQWGTIGMNETWRFIPKNGPALYRSVELLDATGTTIATGDTSRVDINTFEWNFTNVCPPPNVTTLYVVKTTYEKIDNSGMYYSLDTINVLRTNSLLLASSAGNKVCSNKAVVNTGTTYTDDSCNIIAYVLPSGGSPVSGNINACVTIDPGAVQYFNAEPYVQRHYDIEPATANTSTTSATITLYFLDAEFIAFNAMSAGFPKLPTSVLGNADPNISNVRVTQYHGTPTTTPSSPGNYSGGAGNGVHIVPSLVYWNAIASRWEVTVSVTGFSGFYVHTNINFALPVTINYLDGIKQSNTNQLNWKLTCNTAPSVTINLERSADARNFSSIYSVSATALRCEQPFNYGDGQPLNGINYYRLKVTDADGRVTYSNTIAILNATKGFAIVNVAPHPVTGSSFKLNIASADQAKINLVISDVLGRVMATQTVSLVNGYNSIDMNAGNLAPGTYNIYGTTNDLRSGVIRFVKQ